MARTKTIIRLISSLLFILSILLLLPLIIAAIYSEALPIYMAFIITSALSLFLGILFRRLTNKHTIKLDLTSAMLMCTLSWVILSLISAIPFILGLNKSLIDAMFEAVSGFTTTGITVFQGLDTLSPAILFWRSLIQWLGGLGILTFFLLITANSEGELWNLFNAEGHKISASRPVPNVNKTIKYFWMIYGAYTLAETLILFLLGLDFYEALIHSLTTLSTGGFSNHDASIGYYQLAGYANYQLIEYTVIFFMFLGGINFLVHYRMLREDPLAFFKDFEAKTYMKLIGLFSLLTLIGIVISRGLPIDLIEQTLRKTLFQIVSIMTTTGFGNADITSAFFPTITKQIFLLLMIIGGCVGSTAGGVKVLRIIVLQKLLHREVNKLSLPNHAVIPVTIDQIPVEQEEILRITSIIFGWLLLIIIGSGITALFSDLGPMESFSGMASAVGNIGPFYFSVAKMASLSWVIKLTYIIGMLAGRLELLPIYLLLTKHAWKP